MKSAFTESTRGDSGFITHLIDRKEPVSSTYTDNSTSSSRKRNNTTSGEKKSNNQSSENVFKKNWIDLNHPK